MEREKVDRLAELNGFQLAGLAVLASTVAALSVVYALRKIGVVSAPGLPPWAASQPAVPHTKDEGTPKHFSETLLVPGMTFTGEDVAEQDATEGRSPEGV